MDVKANRKKHAKFAATAGEYRGDQADKFTSSPGSFLQFEHQA
jgi:hypothetical protein